MRLQLAEAPQYAYASLAEGIEDNYLNVPDPDTGTIMRVREDYFDNLPQDVWMQLMITLEPYNNGMNGILQNFIAKRQEKKAIRQEKKAAKQMQKQAAKQQRVATRWGALENIGKSIASAASGSPVGADAMLPATMDPRALITGGIDFGAGQPVREWYENPWILGGGAALALTTVYLLTRKS